LLFFKKKKKRISFICVCYLQELNAVGVVHKVDLAPADALFVVLDITRLTSKENGRVAPQRTSACSILKM